MMHSRPLTIPRPITTPDKFGHSFAREELSFRQLFFGRFLAATGSDGSSLSFENTQLVPPMIAVGLKYNIAIRLFPEDLGHDISPCARHCSLKIPARPPQPTRSG
jgi:hypothetical protein